MPPFISTAYNLSTITYTIHITHLCMAMKFYSLIHSSILTLLCRKCRYQLHSIHSANFHLPVICIIKGNTFDSHKSPLLYLLLKIRQNIFICQKHFDCNTICKVCDFQCDNVFPCSGLSFIHGHNLTFHHCFTGTLKYIT